MRRRPPLCSALPLLLLCLPLVAACDSDTDEGAGPTGGAGGAAGEDAGPTADGGGGTGGQIVVDQGPAPGGTGGSLADAGPGGTGGALTDAGPGGAGGSLADAGPGDAAVPALCQSNADCLDGQVCQRQGAACDSPPPTGSCMTPPDGCTGLEEPVCGCDGVTYPNACSAYIADVAVADLGACRDERCDDGTAALCDMIPPVCGPDQILAIRNECWICLDPDTCTAPIACATDTDCGPDDYCNLCAHGSCPLCDDCVAECVPHGCQSENVPACNMVRPVCAEGETAVVRDGCWLCVSRATCEPPAEPGACAAQGGYCEDWQADCAEGYTGQPPLDCPDGRSAQCCVPLPEDCIPAGGSGAVVPGALPCCPGLTSVGCGGPAQDGSCEPCVGAFFCIAPDDGVCGAAENTCNSPADCAEPPPVECETPVDCLDRPWDIFCLGHYACTDGACVATCGETCGDGACNPADGENANTCSTDCE